jgi:quercetin dioxygenase-like cupin family protein
MRYGNLEKELGGDLRGGFVIDGLMEHRGLFPVVATGKFQVRWVHLKKGETKSTPHANIDILALVILISGSHHVYFGEDTVELENIGDYVYIEPGDLHSWEAKEDTLLLVIRWE